MTVIEILATVPFTSCMGTFVLMMVCLGGCLGYVLHLLDKAAVAEDLAAELVYASLDLDLNITKPTTVELSYVPSPGRQLHAAYQQLLGLLALTVCQTVEAVVDLDWDLTEVPSFNQQLQELLEEWQLQIHRLDQQGQAMASLIARAQA